MNVERLFQDFKINESGALDPESLKHKLEASGLLLSDISLKNVQHLIDNEKIDLKFFKKMVSENKTLRKALTGDLVIPRFDLFAEEITRFYNLTKNNCEGKVSSSIPWLGTVNPDYYGISLCTIDAQRIDLGDVNTSFTIQSVSKPINYCLALEEHGEDTVHRYVGREPSGRGFNELQLNDDHLPHNPMLNSGAIMCCSLLQSNKSSAERFDYVMNYWQQLCGGNRPGFNNAVYLSEKENADRNSAIGHFMNEKKIFPPHTDLLQTLEFYFQCCSIELNCKAISVAAATLANGGICPTTGERIFKPETVKNCLSLMFSCGMYDFSGEFAFSVGLPAKSGISGILMLIIPEVMGIAIYSPPLDSLGNSVRGIQFCKMLTNKFNFHIFDGRINRFGKVDPRNKNTEFTHRTQKVQ